jgi:DNA-binding response OmpR family regulator
MGRATTIHAALEDDPSYDDAPEESSRRIVLRHGDVEVDVAGRRARLGGCELDLTDGEFALLLHFARRPNQLITRSELLARVWSMPMHSGSNLVDVVVCRLRRRLGLQGRMIETVRGLGYRFHSPNETAAADPGAMHYGKQRTG